MYSDPFLFPMLVLVVVAQLANRSLLTPEVRGSNPVIGEVLLNIVNSFEKTKIKKKRLGMAHFYNESLILSVFDLFPFILHLSLSLSLSLIHFDVSPCEENLILAIKRNIAFTAAKP